MQVAQNSAHRAFIGVSLDSKEFTREWVRCAFAKLTQKYNEVLVVLADELLIYTRSARAHDAGVVLDYTTANSFAERRAREVRKFFESEARRLPDEIKQRLYIKAWDDFADRDYARLARRVRIAFESIPRFHAFVVEVAELHAHGAVRSLPIPRVGETSTAYVLDEIAMCLRITEIAGYSEEFHPSADISVLQALYAGEFRTFGLTVESLIGGPPKRIFHVLKTLDLSAIP